MPDNQLTIPPYSDGGITKPGLSLDDSPETHKGSRHSGSFGLVVGVSWSEERPMSHQLLSIRANDDETPSPYAVLGTSIELDVEK